MTSALVPLVPSLLREGQYQYRLGSALFHVPGLMVCVTCETVIGSVKDDPICPVCELRAEMERALEEKEVQDDWGDEYGKF